VGDDAVTSDATGGVWRVEEAGGQRMMRTIPFVVGLLLSAATASAEGAWVL